MTIRSPSSPLKICLVFALCFCSRNKSCLGADLAPSASPYAKSPLINQSPAAASRKTESQLSKTRTDGQVQSASNSDNEEFKYIGNGLSGKFHRPGCPFEQAMAAHNAVFFHFRREAIAAGFSPCRYCLPPFVKQVRCVLLKDNSIKETK